MQHILNVTRNSTALLRPACTLQAARACNSMHTLGTIYDFEVKDASGNVVKLGEKYKDKAVIIVNVASECGKADKNYNQLRQLHNQFHQKGLEVAAFPCNQFGQEPNSESKVEEIVAEKYDFEPDVYEKVDVNGGNAHPLWRFLQHEQAGTLVDAIKWNFTKFLVDKHGKVVKRYAPTTEPSEMIEDVQKILNPL